MNTIKSNPGDRIIDLGKDEYTIKFEDGRTSNKEVRRLQRFIIGVVISSLILSLCIFMIDSYSDYCWKSAIIHVAMKASSNSKINHVLALNLSRLDKGHGTVGDFIKDENLPSSISSLDMNYKTYAIILAREKAIKDINDHTFKYFVMTVIGKQSPSSDILEAEYERLISDVSGVDGFFGLVGSILHN